MALAGWVRIEAVLKADGRGLLVDPGRVRFAGDADGTVAWIDGEEARYRVVEVALASDLVAAVARFAGPAGAQPLTAEIRSLAL